MRTILILAGAIVALGLAAGAIIYRSGGSAEAIPARDDAARATTTETAASPLPPGATPAPSTGVAAGHDDVAAPPSGSPAAAGPKVPPVDPSAEALNEYRQREEELRALRARHSAEQWARSVESPPAGTHPGNADGHARKRRHRSSGD